MHQPESKRSVICLAFRNLISIMFHSRILQIQFAKIDLRSNNPNISITVLHRPACQHKRNLASFVGI